MKQKYIDYLVYTTHPLIRGIRAPHLCTQTIRNGVTHTVLLIRTKRELHLPFEYELLSHGEVGDCPFAKLSGDSLVKYHLAYDVTPFREDDTNPELDMTIPSFIFGSFI